MVDTDKVIKTVRHIVELLVRKDYHAISRAARKESLDTWLIDSGMNEYPGTFIIPPDESYGEMRIYEASDPEDGLVAQIEFPLWTKEEGRSDLFLLLTLYESQNDLYEFSFDDLDVM